jgi:hypothetical protein
VGSARHAPARSTCRNPWFLLARRVHRVRDHVDARADRGETDAERAVLGEAVVVPPADPLQDPTPHEHGVPREGHDTGRRVRVQSRPEPQRVLDHVPHPPPRTGVVHDLHSALHDVGARLREPGVHPLEQPLVHVVLGVEHAHDAAGGGLEAAVQCAGLGRDPAVIDHDTDVVGVATCRRRCDARRRRVVVTHDDDHLEPRVRLAGELVERVREDSLLVPSRYEEGERPRARPRVAVEPRPLETLRGDLCVQGPQERQGREGGQGRGEHQVRGQCRGGEGSGGEHERHVTGGVAM